MNSHLGYEFGYQHVVGNEDYNEDVYQEWDDQRWEEPYAYDQSSWQQPPDTHRYNSHPSACQFEGYGHSFFDNQVPPPYAYEPYPQHDYQPCSQGHFY